jgi:hypothetical protein
MNETHKTKFARKIFLAEASLTILFLIISIPLCTAEGNNSIRVAEGNNSISGYVFNDANGNGEWDRNKESGLENWIVYIDENGNFNRDERENHSYTNETGYYKLSGLGNGSYRVREELQAHWTQTIAPKSFRISTGNDGLTDYNFGNIESEMVLINPDQVMWLFWIYLIGAVICFIFGLGIFIYGLRNCKCNTIKDNLENIAKVVVGIILILLGVHLLGNLEDMSGIGGTHLAVDQLPMWALILIAVLLFVALLGVGICKPEQMESGQMRRAIAGLLVFGFVAILVFSLYDKLPVENKEIVSQYIQLVGIIIGFYFGAKITSDAAGMKSEISPPKSTEAKIKIGDPNLDEKEKKLQIPIQNLSENTIKVTRIDLEEVDNFKQIHSEKPEKQYIENGELINVPLATLEDAELKQIMENKYTIKIWLSDGTFRDKEAKPHKKEATPGPSPEPSPAPKTT